MKHIYTKKNGRDIPENDKIFGINSRAKEYGEKYGKENLVNATVGALLDEEGKLIVMDSIKDIFSSLEPSMYAPYASIDGDLEYQNSIIDSIIGDIESPLKKGVVATPGGTGAIKNMIVNYTNVGDSVLTTDWYWATYNTICQENSRKLETFEIFNDNREFNVEGMIASIKEISKKQDSLSLIINTPAHNPTGYSLSSKDWDLVIEALNNSSHDFESICLFIDIAYIDFAGEESEVRAFISKLHRLNDNVVTIMGYSGSKTYTLYGLRIGAMMCLHKSQEIIDEFKIACKFSSRNSWSNSPKAGHEIIKKIYSSEDILKRVNSERSIYREMLSERGKIFEDEAKKVNLEILPFDGGFFVSIPCSNPEEVSSKLEEEGIFVVPLKKGLRVSVASISKDNCRKLPSRIVPYIVK